MRTSIWIVALAAIMTLLQPATSSRATIDFDSGMYYLDYDVEVPAVIAMPGTPAFASIVINSGHFGDPDGVSGVAFGFSGVPTNWTLFFTADPSVVVIGNPSYGQVVVQFPSCQSLQPDQDVVVMQLIIVATTVVSHQQMHIVYSGQVGFQGPPVFLSCDQPPVEQTTAGGVLYINPYTVGVESTSWSGIKDLYRH